MAVRKLSDLPSLTSSGRSTAKLVNADLFEVSLSDTPSTSKFSSAQATYAELKNNLNADILDGFETFDVVDNIEYKKITGVIGVTGTGDLASVTGLSYDSGYATKNGTVTYTIANFSGTGLNTSRIREIKIKARISNNATDPDREASMYVTYPDGSIQTLLKSNYEAGQGETSDWIQLIVGVPINIEQETFTITLDVDYVNAGERAAFEIIGAQQIVTKPIMIPADSFTQTISNALSGYTVIDDDTMASATNQTLSTSESVKAYVDTSRGYLHVRDEKAQGTSAGSLTSGYNIRTLNTTVANSIAGASLGSNQITLPAGTYRIIARAPMETAVNSTTLHRASIYNATSSAYLLSGSNNSMRFFGSQGQYWVGQTAEVIGQLVLSITSTIELRHYVSANCVGGYPLSSGTEIYSEVEIWKIT